MIYVISPLPRSGKLAVMQLLMERADEVATQIKRAFQQFNQGDSEENMSEDEDHPAVEENPTRWCSGSCDLPALPQHQIPWYTSGFQ